MVSLKRRYFLSKVLWGVLFMLTGICKILINQTTDIMLKNILNGLCIVMFLGVIIISFIRRKEKVEPEDELAVLNDLKAKSLIYNTIFVIIIFYLISGSSFLIVINSGVAFIAIGVLQILEYVFFNYYEKKDLINQNE